MGLAKKIGKIFTIGALSFGIMYNLFPINDKKIEQEINKYKSLYIVELSEDYKLLGWDFDGDTYSDIAGYYKVKKESENLFGLRLVQFWTDKNKNKMMDPDEWEDSYNGEYQSFTMEKFPSNKEVMSLYKDENNDGWSDKFYDYYLTTSGTFKAGNGKNFPQFHFDLIGLHKDWNGNHQIDPEEENWISY